MLNSRSTTATRHRMQCGKRQCRKRFTLPKHPKYLKDKPTCPKCLTDKVHSVEKHRRDELKKQNTHSCPAYPFPHRKGSLIMCSFHPRRLQGIEPTEQEIEEYEGTMSRDRTAFSFGTDVPTLKDLPEAPF